MKNYSNYTNANAASNCLIDSLNWDNKWYDFMIFHKFTSQLDKINYDYRRLHALSRSQLNPKSMIFFFIQIYSLKQRKFLKLCWDFFWSGRCEGNIF